MQMPGPQLTDDSFRDGFYGAQVATLENGVRAALSRIPADPFLRRAALLEPGALYLLVTRERHAKPLLYVEDINETGLIDARESLVHALAEAGWMRMGVHHLEAELPALKLPELKNLARHLGARVTLRKAELVRELLAHPEGIQQAVAEVVGGRVFSLTTDARRLLRAEFVPRIDDAAPSRRPVAGFPPPLPSQRRGTVPWYTLRKPPAGEVPVRFRPEHPRRFGQEDFAIWAAFAPSEAAGWYSEALLAAFEYSWRSLLPFAAPLPVDVTPTYFAQHVRAHELLRREFRAWGGVFFHIWQSALLGPQEEPCFYKLLPLSVRGERIARHWVLPDGCTPRVYRLEEVAFLARDFIDTDAELAEDDEDEDWETLLLRRGFARPNLGIQWPDDFGDLVVLPGDWGFKADGSLGYISAGHCQWRTQEQRMRSP